MTSRVDKWEGKYEDFDFDNAPPREGLERIKRAPNGDLLLFEDEQDKSPLRLRRGSEIHQRYGVYLDKAGITPPLYSETSQVPAVELLIMLEEATLGIRPDQSKVQPMTPVRRRAFAQLMREVAEAERKGYIIDIPD